MTKVKTDIRIDKHFQMDNLLPNVLALYTITLKMKINSFLSGAFINTLKCACLFQH